MSDISKDFKVVDSEKKSKKDNKELDSTQLKIKKEKEDKARSKKLFDGREVDPLFLIIYDSNPEVQLREIIVDAVVIASINIMGTYQAGDERELARYNEFIKVVEDYSLQLNSNTWKLEHKKDKANLIPLNLKVTLPFTENKEYRKVRKKINHIDSDIISIAVKEASTLVNKEEQCGFVFKGVTQDEEDRATIVEQGVLEFINNLTKVCNNNNRLSWLIEEIISYVIESIEFDSVPSIQLDYMQNPSVFTMHTLSITLDSFTERATNLLRESVIDLFEYAGEKEVPETFVNGAFVLKHSSLPDSVLQLKGNKYSVYTDFEDSKMLCKMIGIKGVS